VGESITFQWTHAPGHQVILKILSNAGKEVHSVKTERDTYIFRGILKPGLYYWKLESNDELLFVGKILKK
jgi:plastocyanin